MGIYGERSCELLLLLFIARLVVPTKVVEPCRSKKSSSQKHIIPKARKSSTDQDITQASVAQLVRLTAKIPRLHLASRHLSTTGTKTTMVRRLHNTIHALDAPSQRHSVDSSASQPQQDATLTPCQKSNGPLFSQQQGTLKQDTQ